MIWRRVLALVDNHRAHASHYVKADADKLGVQLCYQPPYSSPFNSIEFLWAIVKRQWRQNVLTREGTVEGAIQQLTDICKAIPRDTVKKLFASNHKAILASMNGELV